MFFIYKLKKDLRKYYRRNQKSFLSIILIFSLIVYLSSYLSSMSSIKIDEKYLAEIQNDSNVNTSDYLQRFVEYKAIKRNEKNIYDKKFSHLKTVIPKARKGLNRSSYLIYEYTKFFGDTKNCQRKLNEIYNEECPFKNCKFTCDLNDLTKSDVILFHESDMKNDLKSMPNYIDQIEDMRKQNRKQLYVLWNDEANEIIKSFDRIKFNWTLSYRYDSEVSDCSYGCFHKHSRLNQTKRKELFKVQVKKEFKMRKNSAIGFISNCKPKYRMKFTAELRKHFKTDIHGICSSMIFWKSLLNLSYDTVFGKLFSGLFRLYDVIFKSGSCPRNSLCEGELLQKYKFFLSFESKGCQNYITEKFWRILRYNMIPVVIQPAKRFYEKIAPPDSFIHIEDFDHDVTRLSEYLNKISNNFDLYFKYLKWKFDHDVIYSANMVEKRRMCEFCFNLNTESSVIYYKSISNWFSSGCTTD